MFFKKIKYSSNNDAIMLLRYALLGLLIILTPITLFLTAFSWYASLEYANAPDTNIEDLPLFLKNALIFGSVGLMSFLIYFLIFLAFVYGLKHAAFKWKRIILILAIISATLFFLIFEIFSAIFTEYFYTWQISLVLTFWPIIYVVLFVLLLINYFELRSEEKLLKLNKKSNISQEEDIILRDRTEIIT